MEGVERVGDPGAPGREPGRELGVQLAGFGVEEQVAARMAEVGPGLVVGEHEHARPRRPQVLEGRAQLLAGAQDPLVEVEVHAAEVLRAHGQEGPVPDRRGRAGRERFAVVTESRHEDPSVRQV